MGRPLIDFTLDLADASQEARNNLVDLSVRDSRLATSRSLNKTMIGLRKEIVRRVRQRYEVKAGEVRSCIKIWKANSQSLTARLTVSGRFAVPLSIFKPRPTKPVSHGGRRPDEGVSVKVGKRGIRVTIPGAFLQYTRPAGRGNDDKPKRLNILMRKGSERTPVHIKYGPSFLSVLNAARVNNELQRYAGDRFGELLQRESGFLKNKARGRV